MVDEVQLRRAAVEVCKLLKRDQQAEVHIEFDDGRAPVRRSVRLLVEDALRRELERPAARP